MVDCRRIAIPEAAVEAIFAVTQRNEYELSAIHAHAERIVDLVRSEAGMPATISKYL